jgi:hypothetical protein
MKKPFTLFACIILVLNTNAQTWNSSTVSTSTTDGGTFIQLTSTPWGAQHGLLFNSYKSSTLVNGPLATLGNTKHSNDASFTSGAGAIMFLANGGNMDFLISNQSTGTNTNVNWGVPKMTIARNGNVGINVASPGSIYKLAVAGKIAAWGEVRVFTDNTPFPDYVFDPTYQLPSLEETEKYVKENRHLPEVPSAAEIEKDGMSLNGMNTILLKKVEELTLHIIKQNKRIEALEKKLKN